MKTFDAVVVGSGFGGAVAACRLAERGRSVLVLERGRRWGREDFPRPGQPNAP
ncbi:MAG: FAD-dependent oxidoreductase, partial [Terriglobia bacterium]